MTNEQLRRRVRAVRRQPSRFIVEGMERTLANLPPRRARSFQDKLIMAGAIAAAVALLAVYAAPPIVAAAGALIERLFADRAQRYERQLALPGDEKLAQSVAEVESFRQENRTEARGEFFGMGARIDWVETEAENGYDPSNARGFLRLRLVYDGIPVIDPNYVDFVLVMDGREIPMLISEDLRDFRARAVRMLTEEQWAAAGSDFGGEWLGANSMLAYSEAADGYEPVTTLEFPLDPWRIERKTEMELRATVDGDTYRLRFTFDPEQAHALAVQEAKDQAAHTEAYEREKLDQYRALEADAVPVGVSGGKRGLSYTFGEISVADGQLNLSYSAQGIKEKNPKMVDFWLDELYIDGYRTWAGSGDSDLADGVLTGVRGFILGRDPRKLPDESLIVPNMILSLNPRSDAQLAFRYNWRSKRVTLPGDEAEMKAWIAESKALTASLYADFGENGKEYPVVSGDMEGVAVRITGARLHESLFTIEGEVLLKDAALSEDQWRELWNRCDLEVWVDGLKADAKNNLLLNANSIKPNAFDIDFPPPVNTAEIFSDMPIRVRLHPVLAEAGIDEIIETEFFLERPRP